MAISYSSRLIWIAIVMVAKSNTFLISSLLFLGIFGGLITLLFFSANYIYISPLWMVLIFFSLDSTSEFRTQVKTVLRASKMIVYNYPFFIILTILTWYSWFFTRYIWLNILLGMPFLLEMMGRNTIYLLSNDLAKLILPVFFCFASNFYIKQIHEQFKRYY